MSGTRRGIVAVVAAAALGSAVTVWATEPTGTSGSDTFRSNRTRLYWTTQQAGTSSDRYEPAPGAAQSPLKHFGPVAATFTVRVKGRGPVQFRLQDPRFHPRKVNFDLSASRRSDTFSFTAVKQAKGWSCSDPELDWRSPTGATLELTFVNTVVDHTRKGEEPDYACREAR